ncbi:uncharacterized protein [Paramormyrops kingsleyae]|uniref:uncharacterized protein isoform X2 n=1 Tax=Paramormyrops kingsleyae TaxID=1676925 RepID=UPI000CD62B48|nr:uncharacterized protein LOC111840174 isoform X2 [Paramormyrops kingsleyae]
MRNDKTDNVVSLSKCFRSMAYLLCVVLLTSRMFHPGVCDRESQHYCLTTGWNSSIILLRVQWEDSRKYHCMVSYERAGMGARTRGQGVMLQVHGPMTFNISDELKRKLQCNIEVSGNSNLYLTMFRDGREVARSQNDTSDHHTGLSALIPFENGREYECQLNLGSTVVLTRSFRLQKPHAQDLPEPVFLYAIILLIPLSVLLFFLVILLIRKICCKGSGFP